MSRASGEAPSVNGSWYGIALPGSASATSGSTTSALRKFTRFQYISQSGDGNMMLLRVYMSETQPWLLSSKHKTELSSRDGLVYTHACSPCLRKADCVEVPSSNSQDQGHQTSAQQRHDLLSLKSEPGVFVANPRRPNKALFSK